MKTGPTITIEHFSWTPKVEKLQRPISLLDDFSGIDMTEAQRNLLKELQRHFYSGELRSRLLEVKDDSDNHDTEALRRFFTIGRKMGNILVLEGKLQTELDALYESLAKNPMVEAIGDDDDMDILFCRLTHETTQETSGGIGIAKILKILMFIDEHMKNIAQAVMLDGGTMEFEERFRKNPEVISFRDLFSVFFSVNPGLSVSEIADKFEQELMKLPAVADYGEEDLQGRLRKKYSMNLMIEKPKNAPPIANNSALTRRIGRIKGIIYGLVMAATLYGDTTIISS